MPGVRARSNLMGGRRARKFKSRQLRRIQPVTSTCKSAIIDDGSTINPANSRTLYNKPITVIGQGDARNQRERDICWIKGFRLRMTFHNRTLIPQTCNVAIVCPKDPFPDENVPSLNTFNDAEFFSNLGVAARSGLFANNLLNSLEWGQLPINTDKHSIIWHTRFKLGVQGTGENFSSGELKNYRYLSRYVKVGKKVAYVTSAALSCESPMYLLIWTAPFNEQAGPVTTACMNWTSHIVTYFGDPKK